VPIVAREQDARPSRALRKWDFSRTAARQPPKYDLRPANCAAGWGGAAGFRLVVAILDGVGDDSGRSG